MLRRYYDKVFRRYKMPLPTPREGETKDEFIERCMSESDLEHEMRIAACEAQWERHHGEKQ